MFKYIFSTFEQNYDAIESLKWICRMGSHLIVFFFFSGKKLRIYNFEDINYDLASELKNMCYKTK